MRFRLDIKTVSEANRSEHWAAKAKRTKRQRQAAWAITRSKEPKDGWTFPAVVYLTRIAQKRFQLDDDNLRSALKHVRDGIADAFGLDDRDPKVEWKYNQDVGKTYDVWVTITETHDE